MIKSYIKKLIILIYILVFTFSSKSNASGQKMNLTYLYAGNSSLYTNYIDRSKGAINAVCPDYFEIYESGALKILPKTDQKFVETMHARGIKVIPFLSNHWDRALGRAALNNRVELVSQIVSAVSQYGFD